VDAEQVAAQDNLHPNACGVYNMRGSVWEWCNDWYDRNYYANSPVMDPQGPATGALRVIRNTPWAFSANAVCRINRYPMPPWHRCQFVGFRVICQVADGVDRNSADQTVVDLPKNPSASHAAAHAAGATRMN
jgi:formylglycine-generating enzyme required for sulfatase activity